MTSSSSMIKTFVTRDTIVAAPERLRGGRLVNVW
jgi:hypothetical protein